MTMMTWSLVVALLCGAHHVTGRPDGAPVGACATMRPNVDLHGAGPSQQDFPYSFELSRKCWKAGSKVDVTVKAPSGVKLRGVFVQARRADDRGAAEAFGSFSVADSNNFKTIDCHGQQGSNNAVTHNNRDDKNEAKMTWTAPSSSNVLQNSNIIFRVTVVRERITYWVDQETDVIEYDVECGDSDSGVAAAAASVTLTLMAAATLIQLLF